MIKINDGRDVFVQWDTGRKVTFCGLCDQFHFSNRVVGVGRHRTYDVVATHIDGKVSEGIVPDELLQEALDVHVYVYVGAGQDGFTKVSKTFHVIKRDKPNDYVYTPTDQTSIEEIKQIASNAEKIAQSVRDDADAGLFDGEDGTTPHIGDNGNWFIGDTDTGIGAKGDTGSPGVSPHIGDNGNWFIGDVDTNVHAQGIKGDTGESGVTPHIGENGNWFVGAEDTGVHAQGASGFSPHIGINGNWFIGDVDTNIHAQGAKGEPGDAPYVGKNGNWFVGDKDTGVTARGEKGEPGLTPYVGNNGNWFVGDTDTKTPAQGAKGDSGISPHIGSNGNWFIGEIDTGVPAQGDAGADGITPHIGYNGNWFIGDVDTRIHAQGEQGDPGVYVGSDPAPDGTIVQVDPRGDGTDKIPILSVYKPDGARVPITSIKGERGYSGVYVGENPIPPGTHVQVRPDASGESVYIPDVLQGIGRSVLDTMSQAAITNAITGNGYSLVNVVETKDSPAPLTLVASDNKKPYKFAGMLLKISSTERFDSSIRIYYKNTELQMRYLDMQPPNSMAAVEFYQSGGFWNQLTYTPVQNARYAMSLEGASFRNLLEHSVNQSPYIQKLKIDTVPAHTQIKVYAINVMEEV